MSHGKNNQDQMPDAGEDKGGSERSYGKNPQEGIATRTGDNDYPAGRRPDGGHAPAGAGES